MRKIVQVLCLLLLMAGCKRTEAPPESLGPIGTLYFFPQTGAVGSTITVVGNNFSATATNNVVSFTTADATAFYVHKGTFSDTLKVRVPAGSTTGPLTVRVYSQVATTPYPFILVAGRWTRKADFPGVAGMYGTGFTIGTKTYVVQPGANTMWAYDPNQNTWAQKATCPVGPVALTSRSGELLSFVVNGYAYVGIYLNNYPIDEIRFFRYDPAADAWTTAAPVPRIDAHHGIVFGLGNRGYLVDTDPYTKGVLEYNPQTNSWSRRRAFPGVGRYASTSFALGGKGYLGGGNTGTTSSLLTDFWEYDAQTDTWTQKADLPDTNDEPNGFAVDGRGAMLSRGNATYLYNPATNTWVREADFPGISYTGKVSISADSRGYAARGRDVGNGVYNEFWEFSPR